MYWINWKICHKAKKKKRKRKEKKNHWFSQDSYTTDMMTLWNMIPTFDICNSKM